MNKPSILDGKIILLGLLLLAAAGGFFLLARMPGGFKARRSGGLEMRPEKSRQIALQFLAEQEAAFGQDWGREVRSALPRLIDELEHFSPAKLAAAEPALAICLADAKLADGFSDEAIQLLEAVCEAHRGKDLTDDFQSANSRLYRHYRKCGPAAAEFECLLVFVLMANAGNASWDLTPEHLAVTRRLSRAEALAITTRVIQKYRTFFNTAWSKEINTHSLRLEAMTRAMWDDPERLFRP